MSGLRCLAIGIFCFAAGLMQLPAQEPSFHEVSGTIEVGTAVVAFNSPRAEVLTGTALATPANIALLANVKKICVLPYDGWNAKIVIQALPSTDPVQQGLQNDKSLRQLRNEASDELEKTGFQTIDCLSSGNDPDAELVFTRVRGGFGSTNLRTYYWVLYAGPKSAVLVHGEKELPGLSRPAAIWVPLNLTEMVQQVKASIDIANRSK